MTDDKKKYRDLLTEAKKGTIVVAWGRFSPPTTGHEKLIIKVAAEASSRNADYRVYPTKTEDPKKNPLSFQDKVKFMRVMFPRHARNISSDKKLNTIIKAAQALEKEGYANLVLVAGSDRIKEFKTLLTKYNGKDYNFESIDVVSAGDRDPDAEGVSGMSASKMRAAAAEGDFNSFKSGVPRSFKQEKKLYDAVRAGMNINEESSEVLDEVVSKKVVAAVAAGVALKTLGVLSKKRQERKARLKPTKPEKIEQPKEVEVKGGVSGKRFDRMLRFGLSVGGTGDIPLTKRAFKDFDSAQTNPILRKKVFATVDRTFDLILNDPILYNRFLVLLHRKGIFGEESMIEYKQLINSELNEAAGTAALSDKDDYPNRQNYVATFNSIFNAKGFIKDLSSNRIGSVTWVSPSGTEVQFTLYVSSAGNEGDSNSDSGSAEQSRRGASRQSSVASADVRIVDLVAKYGGKVNAFDGDVREGLEEDSTLIERLNEKSETSDISVDILLEVFVRGLEDWIDSDNTKMSPVQWAYSRLNSFISGGKSREILDADLWEECISNDNINEDFENEFNELNEEFELFGESVDVLFNVDEEFDEIEEEHGAGDEATTKLRKKYTKDTPGQGCVDEGQTVKFTKGTGDTNDYDFPLKGETAELVGVDGGNLVAYNKKHGEFTVTNEKYKVIKEGRRVDENIENPYMRRASNRNTFNMKLKTGPPTKEQMRKRVDREREAAEKKKKGKKLKEARLTPAQRLLTKKAETQIKKDDPKAFDPGQGSKYQEPTKKHVGIIKDRERAHQEKMANLRAKTAAIKKRTADLKYNIKFVNTERKRIIGKNKTAAFMKAQMAKETEQG